jgi:hypothetical protein
VRLDGRGLRQADCSCVAEQVSDRLLRSLVPSLAEVVVLYPALSVGDVERRPILLSADDGRRRL